VLRGGRRRRERVLLPAPVEGEAASVEGAPVEVVPSGGRLRKQARRCGKDTNDAMSPSKTHLVVVA